MRIPLLAPLLLLAACEPVITTAILAGNLAIVPVFGRGAPDLVVSVMTGRDCSVVRLEAGRSYCRDAEAPPAAPVFCTRSLGNAACWVGPQPGRRGIADGPTALTPAQEAHRTRGWPGWSREGPAPAPEGVLGGAMGGF